MVIAIIGMLSSVVLASLNTARAKARNSARNSAAIELRTAFNLANNGSGYPNVSYTYPCVTTSCNWAGSIFTADTVVDAYLAPYIKKPVDPPDGTRGYVGFILLTPANWAGGTNYDGTGFGGGYYLDYLLEPGGTCPSGSVWYPGSSSAYVQCVLRIDA